MSDDSTTTDAIPEPPPASTSAPAIQTDTLWGGPQWVHNAGPEPVWVETKEQYWDLLNRAGFTMKDQQESKTGPEREPIPWVAPPASDLEPVAPAPITKEEAEILHAYKGVLQKYGLVESLWCERCFKRGVPHGCRAEVGAKRVRIECRCGVAEFVPPKGTTDLLTQFGNSARVLNDRAAGGLVTAEGRRALPADLLSSEDARAIRKYTRFCRVREYDPLLYCRACATGPHESTGMDYSVTNDQIVLTCQCRMLFYAGTTLCVPQPHIVIEASALKFVMCR